MRDEELVARLVSREETGLAELLSAYGALMRYVAAPILPEPRDLEECIQDAALRIWERIEQYDAEKGSFSTWLTAIVRNTAIDHRRRLRRESSLTALSEEIPAPDGDPAENILETEERAELLRALAQLSAREQAIFYRKYYYLQSTAQIAAELGCTERGIEGKLYRIKRKLRRMMGGERV